MRIGSLILIGIVLISWTLVERESHAQILERTLELRDGSIVQIRIADQEIPWNRVSSSGEVTSMPVSLKEIKRLHFSESPATAQVAEIRRLLNRLGSPNYSDREEAQRVLILNGGLFGEVIRQFETKDREIQWRLDEIIDKIQNKTGEFVPNNFDVLTYTGSKETVDGDAGDWKAAGDFRGLQVSLDRTKVLELHDITPELKFGSDSEARGLTRINENPQQPDKPIRAGFDWVNFDVAPNKSDINSKQILNDVYISQGVRIKSDRENGLVMAHRYNCGGLSGHMCCGAVGYEGNVEINFCMPGKSNFPGGVTFVACQVSAVKPDGTVMEAYNGFGQLIGSIKTIKAGSDYLAIESSEPIARVRLLRVPEIDADFAFDDLYFSNIRPLLEGGDPEYNTLVLNNGDRLQCSSLKIESQQFLAEGITFTDQSLKLTQPEIAVLIPRRPSLVEKASAVPVDGEKDPDDTSISPGKFFVQLIDGSMHQVELSKGKLRSIRFDVDIKSDHIAAFWNAGQGLRPLDEDHEIPMQGATLGIDSGLVDLDAVTWGESWIDSPSLAERADLKFSYENSPAIFFHRPVKIPENAGVVRTIHGDVYWLGDSFKIDSLTDQEITITAEFGSAKIPLTEVNSIRFPRE
jgi:hypothetical protein